MRSKTRYMLMVEQQLGMPLERFILDYKDRGEARLSVARRTGIPVRTLIEWEQRFVREERTFSLR